MLALTSYVYRVTALVVFAAVAAALVVPVVGLAHGDDRVALVASLVQKDSTGKVVSSATVYVILPKIMVPDILYNVTVKWERQLCHNLWYVQPYAAVRVIAEAKPDERIVLAAVSVPLKCGTPAKGEATVTFVVPSSLYAGPGPEALRVTVQVVNAILASSTTATLYLVPYEPQVSVKVLSVAGYLELAVNETGYFTVRLASDTGAIIKDISIDAPENLIVFATPSTPITVPPEGSAEIVVGVTATKPVAGIVRVTISYSAPGLPGEKEITVWVPVVAAPSKVWDLIRSYRDAVAELRAALEEAEKELGIAAGEASTISARLTLILERIEELVATYEQARPGVENATRQLREKVALLEAKVNSLEEAVKDVKEDVSAMREALDSLKKEMNYLKQRLGAMAAATYSAPEKADQLEKHDSITVEPSTWMRPEIAVVAAVVLVLVGFVLGRLIK